jgi:hypothetical protein
MVGSRYHVGGWQQFPGGVVVWAAGLALATARAEPNLGPAQIPASYLCIFDLQV